MGFSSDSFIDAPNQTLLSIARHLFIFSFYRWYVYTRRPPDKASCPDPCAVYVEASHRRGDNALEEVYYGPTLCSCQIVCLIKWCSWFSSALQCINFCNCWTERGFISRLSPFSGFLFSQVSLYQWRGLYRTRGSCRAMTSCRVSPAQKAPAGDRRTHLVDTSLPHPDLTPGR